MLDDEPADQPAHASGTCIAQWRADMPKPGTRYLFSTVSTGLLFCLVAGCGTEPSSERDDEIACGYYVERGSYALANLVIADFASETTWTMGVPLSRHVHNPAGAFAWVPLAQPTVLQHGGSSTGGLGKVSNDGRCYETLSLFEHIEQLVGDPDGFTDVEQQAELAMSVVGFAFPSSLAAAEAAPDSQDVTVSLVADLTRDKTKLVGAVEVRQQLAKQTVTLSTMCSSAPQVTRRWVARTDRDDPAFCRPAGADTECVQFNLVFAPERCELASDPGTLQLPSGRSEVALGGALIRSSPATYSLRIDDIRLFGAAR